MKTIIPARLIIIAALLILTACSLTKAKSAPAQERVTVTHGPIEEHIVANGHVIARNTTTLAFNHTGRILQVNVNEGDSVTKGQILATIDTREIELIAKQQEANYISVQAQYSQTLRGGLPFEVRQAQSELTSASVRLQDLDKAPAQSQVIELEANVRQAELEVKRAQAAYDSAYTANPAGIGGSPEAAALEQKVVALESVKARLASAYEKPKPGQYAEVRAQVAGAQAKLNALKPLSETVLSRLAQTDQAYFAWQQAKQVLEDAQIVAPFDGLITSVNMVPGDIANSGSLIQLVDFSEPTFEADVDEADLADVEVDQDAHVLLQSGIDTPITATVESIGKIGHQSSNLVVYRVRLKLEESDNPDTPEVLLNMSGTAQLVIDSVSNAVLVPARALTLDPDSDLYTVQRITANSDVIQTVQVETGLKNSEMVQVTKGLSEGDVLVVPEPEDIPLEQVTVN